MPAATFLLGDLLVAAESTVAAVEAPGIGESPVGRKSTGMMGALAGETGAFVSGSETPRYGIGAPPGSAGASPPEAEAKAAGGAGASAGGTVALSPEAEVKAAGGTVASAGGVGASAGASAGEADASPPEAAGTSSPPEAEAKAAGEAGASAGASPPEAAAKAAGGVGASAGGTVASTGTSAGASPPEAAAKAAGASSTSSVLANHRSSVSADTLEISAAEGEVVVTGTWATASEAPVTPPPYGGTKANGWALALAIPSVLNASAPPETSDGPKASLAGMGPLGVSTVPASGATPDCSGDGSQPMAGDTEGAVGSGIAAVSTPPQVAVGLSDDTVSPLATATSSAPGTGAAVSGKGPSGAT